ncbi:MULTISPECIES: helix-turn-helix transcriptional regulator [Paenibacillus]|uniref:HTH cro/C1-type domain-containing protein n=1 Tax=Paenibacillus odorifer TaxID=189426 RepID=A0ABX3GTN2_9BACL|nr:helix-turn-helix transcriptional regulator [Paenibacillus odorifer]OMC79603.1 hypothetical protein BK125_04805 [Paenibacillus odorifer]OMD34949.1 hypothetical protein BSO21_10050 [Paenibacillus odorifer]
MAQPKTRLEKLRKLNFLSQKEVAEELGVSQQFYYKIESGKARLNIEMAKSLKGIFHLQTIDELIEEQIEEAV